MVGNFPKGSSAQLLGSLFNASVQWLIAGVRAGKKKHPNLSLLLFQKN